MTAAVETMMYAGETPWHGEGTPVPANVTGDEVDTVSGLNWTVDLKKIQVCGGRGVDGYRAVVRSSDSKALGIVSDDYSPLQNAELRSICDAIVGEGGAHFHTAGSLNGGEDVWYLLQLPGTIVLPGDDVVEKFLLGTTNHVAKRRARILPTPIRVVCANTLGAALGKGRGKGVSITHIGNLQERIAQAIKTVKMALGYYNEFEVLAQRLSRARYSDKQVAELGAEMFPAKAAEPVVAPVETTAEAPKAPEVHWLVKKQRERLADLFVNGKGHKAIEGTAWAAWNAVAEFTDWERGTDANRVDAAWFGDGAKLKQKALEVITAQVDGSYKAAA